MKIMMTLTNGRMCFLTCSEMSLGNKHVLFLNAHGRSYVGFISNQIPKAEILPVPSCEILAITIL